MKKYRLQKAIRPILHCLLLALALSLVSAGQAMSEETSGHSAYRVTAYTLGAFVDKEGGEKDFTPLMITGNAADILNSEYKGSVSWVEVEPHRATNRGFALAAKIEASEKISVKGAFGLSRNLWTPDSIDYENTSSWEANLGVIYKLLNNLSYELHFGYMEPGKLFTDQSSYTDVESIIMISNRLTMSF